MKKRILALVLALCLLTSLLPVAVFATEGETQEGLAAPVVEVKQKSNGDYYLEWNRVDGAVSYEVYRSTDGSKYTLWNWTSTYITGFTPFQSEAGGQYYYKVVALDENGNRSAYSNVVTLLLQLKQPQLTVNRVNSTGLIKISWDEVPYAVQYKVYRSLTGEDGSWSRISTTTKTTVTNTKNYDRAQKYYYKVIALAENEAGNSAYSEVKSCVGKLAQPVVTVSNIESSGKIKITWTKVDGAVKYEIYRATSKTGTYSLLYTTKNNAFNNTSATAGTTYYYKVRALAADPAANSDFSAVKSRTCDLPCPVLTAGVNTKGQPKVTWKAVDGAVSYKVYRSTTLDGSYSLTKTTTSTTYINTTAVAYETYYYKVVAVASNTAANSAKSAAKGISCTTVNITPSKLSKDFVARVNDYREYNDIDVLEWHKDGELTCRTRAAEYHIDFTGNRPDGRSVEKMLEAGKVQIELGLQADATAEDVVDVLMYYDDYEDYADILMYEGWDYAVVACNNGYWCIMFG